MVIQRRLFDSSGNEASVLLLKVINYYMRILGVATFDALPSSTVRGRIADRLAVHRGKAVSHIGALVIAPIARCALKKKDPPDTAKERGELTAELETLHRCFPLPKR